MPTTHLLYLHGFRSSPKSTKAQMMAEYVQRHHPNVTWWCPQLPVSPKDAMAMVLEHVKDWPSEHMAVIGSSLGGFYATWVAHHKRCKLVVLNPSVFPDHSLAHMIGHHPQWHTPEEAIYFRPEYIDELKAMGLHDAPAAGAQLGIFAKGDEVLDWRQMVARYPEAQQIVLEGGDHAISDFAPHLSTVAEFIDLA